MSKRQLVILLCALFALALSAQAADKRQARITKIGDVVAGELRVSTMMSLADTCFVRHDSGLIYRIDSWVYGDELYKNLLDPAQSCAGPYPFTIYEINMPMIFQAATPLIVSVDIEMVDESIPNCPTPGATLAMSADYQLNVPGAGVYDIWIPLDAPIVVNGPFFAGFFIGNQIDPAVGAAVITDDIPVACASYNAWDLDIGMVDLTNNEWFNFPGRLVLYASGIPGGSGGPNSDPPEISIVSPTTNDVLLGQADVWAWETTGSSILDYVSFQYSANGSTWTEFGRDYDGIQSIRSGTTGTGDGDGFRLTWNFSALTEGSYYIKAIAYDTLGQTGSDSILVTIEPTPPIPTIILPNNTDDFCQTLDVLMTNGDENMTAVTVTRQNAVTSYSANLVTLHQARLGDTNGNPNDGNAVANGEFGDYCNGPAAAAIAIKGWADRGYSKLMRVGVVTLTIEELGENLATLFNTQADQGTYDENFVTGLQQFLIGKGNVLTVDQYARPDYFSLRQWTEAEQRIVMIAVGGTAGYWLTVDGFNDWKQADGSYKIVACNPLNGTKEALPMRRMGNISQVYIDFSWQQVDLMVSLIATDWTVTRSNIGADVNGTDGWSVSWLATGLSEDTHHFIRAEGFDATGIRGSSTILVTYNCAGSYTPGDYDNNGLANVLDLDVLTGFIVRQEAAPTGGAVRADANCDGLVNITDIVYYMNFLFGTVGAPCY